MQWVLPQKIIQHHFIHKTPAYSPVSTGKKVTMCEADHSPPYSAEIKNNWNYASTLTYIFMVWCLIKHRANFTSASSEKTGRLFLKMSDLLSLK
jgi:hypothetical protein